MELLAGTLYDPGTAVAFICTGTRAMTAFDTTNLRLSFTARSSAVLVKIKTCLSGATTMPQVLLGVLDGATVKGRQVPMAALPGTALATTNVPLQAEFLVATVSGTAYTWDAAAGVETLVQATYIRYGGPNNTTANDAWGGFAFEIWNPIAYIPSTIVTNTDKTGYSLASPQSFNLIGNISGTYVGNLQGTVNAVQGGSVSVSGTVIASAVQGGTVSVSGTVVSSVVQGGTVTVSGTVTASVASVPIVGTVTGSVGSVVASVTSSAVQGGFVSVSGTVVVGTNNDKSNYQLTNNQVINFSGTITNVVNVLNPVVSSSVQGGYVIASGTVTATVANVPVVGMVTGSVGGIVGFTPSLLDVAVSSRMASGTVIVDGLTPSNLDVPVSSRLSSGTFASTYVNPPTASQVSTQVLSDAASSPIASNVKKMNDVTLQGDGSTTPWGP